jgi:hypothetical protein
LGSTLLAAAAVAGFFLLLGRQIQGTYDKTCMTVSAIATDAQKMRYVQAWAAARIRDQRFMEAIRESPSFERGDPRSPHYIDLDWRSLGFMPELAWIEFNLNRRDGSTVDAMDIASVSLTQGRSTIIIRLNAAGDLGLHWPPDAMAELRPVSQDVFVDCEFSEGPRP